MIAIEGLHDGECNPSARRRSTAAQLFAAACALLLFAGGVSAQEATLAGVVILGEGPGAGGPVEGAVVGLMRGDVQAASALTDADGRFRMTVAPGAYRLRILRIGFRPFDDEVTLAPGLNRETFTLEQVAVALEGVRVDAARARERERFEEFGALTARELRNDELKLVPGVGEADPLRAIEVLPGVVSTSDFTASFNVRGGSADQNLILVDGIPIFSPFHLGGVFSVFNADLIDRAELQSGGFAAEYGGRVSSVLLVETDPGEGEFDVSGGVSLLAARAAVSGGAEALDDALGLQDTRWRVSGRRSYIDVLLAPVTDIPYNLADLQAVVETGLDSRTRLKVSAYTGEDVVDLTNFDPETFPLRIQWDWGNRILGARLIRSLDRGSLEVVASTTRFGTGLAFPDFQDTEFRSQINQNRAQLHWVQRPAAGIETRVGASVDGFRYDNLFQTGGTTFGEGLGTGTQLAGWGQVAWRQPGRWLVEAGLRVDHFRPDPGETITEWSPRLAVKRFFGQNRYAIKAAAGRYTQFLHSLRDEELPIGLDVWVLAGDRAPHVVSDQLQIGVEAFPVDGWNVALEAFYRDFDGVVTFNNGDDPNTDLDDILAGTGVSWGADLFLRRSTGTVNGWISLSYLRADRTFPDFLSPEFGLGTGPAPTITYPPIFDRRVDMDLVLRFPAPRGWTAGLRLNVGTGTPYTRADGAFATYQPRFLEDGGRLGWAGADQTDDDFGGYSVVLGDRNAERYPIYHRLDLSFRKRHERSWGSWTPYLDILNVYNRRNVLFYFFEYDQSPAQRSGISMFPILPTFGVEVTF